MSCICVITTQHFQRWGNPFCKWECECSESWVLLVWKEMYSKIHCNPFSIVKTLHCINKHFCLCYSWLCRPSKGLQKTHCSILFKLPKVTAFTTPLGNWLLNFTIMKMFLLAVCPHLYSLNWIMLFLAALSIVMLNNSFPLPHFSHLSMFATPLQSPDDLHFIYMPISHCLPFIILISVFR